MPRSIPLAHQKAWPADAVERRKIADLTPYASNARTHSDKQIDQIAASIAEFGFTVPVLIDPKGGIIAGHGRVLAAERMGLAELPVMVATGWSAAQKRAYVIADNKLAMNAGWDENTLADELKALGAEGYDLALTGFDGLELVSFLSGNDGLTDPEDVPEVPAVAVSRPGDIWLCGDHRVICGDSTVAEHVSALLDGAQPHLMVTDPPYGVEYNADWRNQRVRANGSPIVGRAIGKVENDGQADWREAYSLFGGDVAYAWSAGLRSREAIEGLEASGFELRAQIIWTKQQFAIGRGDYHFKHEPCWYAVRKGRVGHWNGDRKQTTVWEIDKPRKSETGHSTQKPVECMKRPIENNSQPGDAVYDPFLGPGTTMIAAEMTGRKCYGIELSPIYVDVIVRRWEAFTGREATLEGAGTFAETAVARS